MARSQRIRLVVEGRLAIKIVEVREWIFGSFGYDAEQPVRECELEERERRKIRGFDKELSEGDKRLKRIIDYGSRRWLYSSVVREKLNATADSYSDIEEIAFKMGSSSVNEVSTSGRTNESDNEGELGLKQFPGYGLSLSLTNLAKGIMNAIGACPVQLNGNMREVITVCDHLNAKWKNEGKVRRITTEDILQFYGVKNFKASRGTYFCASLTRHYFFDLNSAGRTWNDNIIWLKGNCLQRDDEEPLDLRFKIVKKSVKFKVERKESLLDKVVEEETELELVLEVLGLSRKKRDDSRSNKVQKAQSTRSMAGVDEGKRQVSSEEARTNFSKTSGTGSSVQPNPVMRGKIALKYPNKRMLKFLPASGTTESGKVAKDKRMRVEPSGESGEKVAYLIKGIWLGIEEEKSELKKANVELEKDLVRLRTDALKDIRQLKAFHAVAIGQLQVETKSNLDKMVDERDRLGRHLMLKGNSEEEVNAIKVDTYVEEEDKVEAEAVGIVDNLDGISRQTVLDNQGDDVELPEGGSEKAVREMSLKINDLEYGLARKRETSKALLSAQAELQGIVQKGNANLRDCQHKLDVALIREKVIERKIKAKESLVKRKEELLKDMLAKEVLNVEIGRRCARAVDLEAINLAESAKYIAKLDENIIYHAKVDTKITENEYA
ncbi:hypothetical protein GIB67_009740, partial [Kingdonia uniflora]